MSSLTTLGQINSHAGRGRRGRRGRRGQRGPRLGKAERARITSYAKSLHAQGLKREEVHERVRLARRSLLESRIPRQGGLHPGPAIPGASGARDYAQGAYLAPGQVSQRATTPFSIADEPQKFTGMGAMSPQAAAQIAALQRQAGALARAYVQPSTAKGSAHEGGASLYVDPRAALQTSYIEGQIQLQPICDETGKCIAYVDPAEVERMIGQTVEGQTALRQGQAQLPGFYAHPSLGPYGVDPAQAYQYWQAQQAAMQAATFAAPMPVWGSPGLETPAAPLPGSPGASTSFADGNVATERF